jgi:hypothetical protein
MKREEVVLDNVEPVDAVEEVVEGIEEVIDDVEVVEDYEPECNVIEGTCGREVVLVDDNPYE